MKGSVLLLLLCCSFTSMLNSYGHAGSVNLTTLFPGRFCGRRNESLCQTGYQTQNFWLLRQSFESEVQTAHNLLPPARLLYMIKWVPVPVDHIILLPRLSSAQSGKSLGRSYFSSSLETK